MAPRPILKRTSATYPLNNNPPTTPTYSYSQEQRPAVHFPPSPSLARTIEIPTYDRSPIVVVPNNCALPERGCPGRTYYYEARCRQQQQQPPALGGPPPLIPDLSSESEESDGFISPPPQARFQYPLDTAKYPQYHHSTYDTRSRSIQQTVPYTIPHDTQPKPRRSPRRSDFNDDVDPGYVEDADLPFPATPRGSPKRSPNKRSSTSPTLSKRFAEVGFQSERDEGGCLEGF